MPDQGFAHHRPYLAEENYRSWKQRDNVSISWLGWWGMGWVWANHQCQAEQLGGHWLHRVLVQASARDGWWRDTWADFPCMYYTSSWRKQEVTGFILPLLPIPRFKQHHHDETEAVADGIVQSHKKAYRREKRKASDDIQGETAQSSIKGPGRKVTRNIE